MATRRSATFNAGPPPAVPIRHSVAATVAPVVIARSTRHFAPSPLSDSAGSHDDGTPTATALQHHAVAAASLPRRFREQPERMSSMPRDNGGVLMRRDWSQPDLHGLPPLARLHAPIGASSRAFVVAHSRKSSLQHVGSPSLSAGAKATSVGESNGNGSAETPSSVLECPICNERMVTLGQLNRHLDVEHHIGAAATTSATLAAELADTNATDSDDAAAAGAGVGLDLDAIKTWFRGKIAPAVVQGAQRVVRTLANEPTYDAPTGSSPPDDPTEDPAAAHLVTRHHWHLPRWEGELGCTACGAILAGESASWRVARCNCRRCGRLFCQAHVPYRMRLNAEAAHDPIAGVWCRVCADCFRSREGYADALGATRSRMHAFEPVRRRAADRANLEMNRLEKRVEKLTRIHAGDVDPVPAAAAVFTLPASALKAAEQTVVRWEPDADATTCPWCGDAFHAFRLRKHHCRLCGMVVCAKQTCSTMLPLTRLIQETEKSAVIEEVVGVVRCCKDCRRMVTIRAERKRDLEKLPVLQSLYMTLSKLRGQIEQALPRFNSLVAILHRNRKTLTPQHVDVLHAMDLRRTLLDLFAKYDGIVKRIGQLETRTRDERKLQLALQIAANHFLQDNMLTLSTLPKLSTEAPRTSSLLKRVATTAKPTTTAEGNGAGDADGGVTMPQRRATMSTLTAKLTETPPTDAATQAMDLRATRLRDELAVLRQQRDRVASYLGTRVEPDEVLVLQQNVTDIDTAIEKTRRELAQAE